MAQPPEIALLVSTYQRPQHLRRCLLSIALQREVGGKMEIVVTDDGSTDETPQVVQQFAASVDFPVRFTTHPHKTFQLARCRNEGVAASKAPYLLFLDGDCILPPDHVAVHLRRRRRNTVMAGDCARLDEATSARVDEAAIRRADFIHWAGREEIRRLRKQDRKGRLYQWFRHRTKPKLIGNNVGIWRSDYERVNGFDENYEGWGGEDNDLRFRLHRAGVRVNSILRWTYTYHLWHPLDVTAPVDWRQGRNVAYLRRKGALVRCRNGLVKRPLDDLRLRVVGHPPQPLAQWISNIAKNHLAERPEVEVLFHPGIDRFSGRADCNVLVVTDDTPPPERLARRAHVVIANHRLHAPLAHHHFRLEQFDEALRAVA